MNENLNENLSENNKILTPIFHSQLEMLVPENLNIDVSDTEEFNYIEEFNDLNLIQIDVNDIENNNENSEDEYDDEEDEDEESEEYEEIEYDKYLNLAFEKHFYKKDKNKMLKIWKSALKQNKLIDINTFATSLCNNDELELFKWFLENIDGNYDLGILIPDCLDLMTKEKLMIIYEYVDNKLKRKYKNEEYESKYNSILHDIFIIFLWNNKYEYLDWILYNFKNKLDINTILNELKNNDGEINLGMLRWLHYNFIIPFDFEFFKMLLQEELLVGAMWFYRLFSKNITNEMYLNLLHYHLTEYNFNIADFILKLLLLSKKNLILDKRFDKLFNTSESDEWLALHFSRFKYRYNDKTHDIEKKIVDNIYQKLDNETNYNIFNKVENLAKLEKLAKLECDICMNEEKKLFVNLECNHYFCKECYNELDKCPVCFKLIFTNKLNLIKNN